MYDGAKVIKRVTLKAANLGRLTVTLPRLAKGTHKIRVLYSGNGYVARSASAYSTLIVK
ncbi:Ig-like domain-containing protein [Nocardioides convexus]|uniref:Ig-like domain-containing protein n=1 Tax=Nocardioides convexus TaxID=2712224 RepID=UPI00241855FA|nr:Ig-like domain-containing protein [Nocardioides convexus]